MNIPTVNNTTTTANSRSLHRAVRDALAAGVPAADVKKYLDYVLTDECDEVEITFWLNQATSKLSR